MQPNEQGGGKSNGFSQIVLIILPLEEQCKIEQPLFCETTLRIIHRAEIVPGGRVASSRVLPDQTDLYALK